MFLRVGENCRRSSGIQRSANLGKLLYTRPASRPATKAPESGGELQEILGNPAVSKLGETVVHQA